MKFCPNCGNQLGDNEKFCGKCGSTVDNVQQVQPAGAAPAFNQSMQQNIPPQGVMPQQPYGGIPQQNMYQQAAPAAPKPNPMAKVGAWFSGHKTLAIIVGAALIVVIVAIIILANIFKYQRINAQDLFKIEFSGIDTCGVVSGKLNAYESYVYTSSDFSASLSSALGDYGVDLDLGSSSSSSGSEDVSPYFSTNNTTLLNAWTKADDANEAITMRKALLTTNSEGNYILKVKFDKEENLKNGDTVKCTVQYDEDLLKDNNIKLTNTEFEVTVKGLEEGQAIDFFDGVNVTFSGNDGKGYPEISTTDAYDFVYFDWDYSSSLSNGDTFTVTAKYYGYNDLNKAGDSYWFEYDDKYYTCSGETATKDFKVEGLTELTVIDPFENIDFKVDRATPFLRVTGVDTENCDEILQSYVYYYVEDADNLDVGDTFTVKASGSYYLEDEGYKLSGTPDSDGYITKEFTVDNTFPSYIKADEAEKSVETFASKAADAVTTARENIKGNRYIGGIWLDENVDSISSFDKTATYLAFNKKSSYDAFGWGDSVNQLIILYKVEVKMTVDDKDTKDTLYVALTLSNVKKNGDEYVSDNEFSISYYKTLDDFKSEVIESETYNVTKAGTTDSSSTDSSADSTAETTTVTTTTAAVDEEPETDESEESVP